MSNSLSWRFALSSMKRNRLLSVVFILSNGIMLSLFYTLVSLKKNDFVLHRHEVLPILLSMGIIITSIFITVFAFYSNRFSIKWRHKEFALYRMLGLQKKHIAKLLGIEMLVNYVLLACFSIFGGHAIGKLLFLLLNYLTKHPVKGFKDYTFNPEVVVFILGFEAVLCLVLYLFNLKRMVKISPIELMQHQHSGEQEPKSRWFLGLLGLLSLIIGYGIALYVSGVLASINFFFVAVLFVIFGTYMLFVSLTIVFLKLLKRNKNYYYKTKHFLSVTGMLYRMKSNAVGLASIALLSTAIIVTLATTSSIYLNMDTMVETITPSEWTITARVNNLDEGKAEAEKVAHLVETQIPAEQIANKEVNYDFSLPVIAEPGKINFFKGQQDSEGLFSYLTVEDVESFNLREGTHYTLAPDEVLMENNFSKIKDGSNWNIMGQSVTVHTESHLLDPRIGVEQTHVLVANRAILSEWLEKAESYNPNTQKMEPAQLSMTFLMNLQKPLNKEEAEAFKAFMFEQEYQTSSREETIDLLYSLNGGFLFLGIIIGLIFIIGTALMIYYKQMTEGFEDRERFQIMKKVGLSQAEIKRTSRSQMVWIFLMPIIVATIHSLVASKILSQLLRLFGNTHFMDFFWVLLVTIGCFALCYFVIYRITARLYYNLIH